MTKPLLAMMAVMSLVTGLSVSIVTVGSAGAATSNRSRPSRPISWLVAGDSYSSGQGLPYESGTCAQADDLGAAEPGAWGVEAADTLSGKGGPMSLLPGSPAMVACTGAPTAEFFNATSGQPPEWIRTQGRYDLVSFTFGGDDVGFTSVIEQCLGISPNGIGSGLVDLLANGSDPTAAYLAWAHDPLVHCPSNTSERAIIAKDLGPSSKTSYQSFLIQVAKRTVTSGGNVVILGYPELIEDPSLWLPIDKAAGLCQGIRPSDALELRGLAGDLNATISQAVSVVNAMPASKRNNVDFTYIDVNTGNPKEDISYNDQNLFEPNDGPRHNLCSSQEWINGLTLAPTGPNLATTAKDIANRSFHPNQEGNNAMARLVNQVFPTLNWAHLTTPLTVVRSQLSDLARGLGQTIVTVPNGYEAATWDQEGHIEFWKYTNNGPWNKVGISTYPLLGSPQIVPPMVSVTGALLNGMVNATFIADGYFSADGVNNAYAYATGPKGWGLLRAGPDNTLQPSGKGASFKQSGADFNNHPVNGVFKTEENTGVFGGAYFKANFVDGLFKTEENTGVFSDAFGAGFPLVDKWQWSGTRFLLKNDNITTAQPSPPPTLNAPPLPSASPPNGTYGATLAFASEVALPGGRKSQVSLTLIPGAIAISCAPIEPCSEAMGPTEITISASGEVSTTYPIVAGEATSSPTVTYITGPLWALAGFGQFWETNEGEEPPGTWYTPSSYEQLGYAPWYIPSSLIPPDATFGVGANETVELTFRDGVLRQVLQYYPL